MADKALFKLVHAEARRRAVAAVSQAPEGWVVSVSEPTRSLDLNSALHARIGELGEALGWKWKGYDVDLEALKRIFMVAYRKMHGRPSRMLPGIDGEPVVIDWRTSAMTQRECSELVDMIDAWAAENLETA